MLEVVPLNALVYDASRAGDWADLLAPPYDVVDAAQRTKLAARSAFNAVHVILPEGGDGRYEQAATRLCQWITQGVVRCERASMWRYEQRFVSGGKNFVRRAIVAGVRVQPFDARVILPHERTHSAPKEDRYRLKMATRCHLSPFFGLYDDRDGAVQNALGAEVEGDPVFECQTPDGLGHRLHRIPQACTSAISAAFAPRRLVIADGHHRYETMLRLAEELGTAESRVGFACLVRLQDPGLVIWPTHRLLAPQALETEAFLAQARNWFVVETRPRASADEIELILAALRGKGPAFARVTTQRDAVEYFQLSADADLRDLPEPLRPIEAALLERVLNTLDIPSSALSTTHDAAEAISRVDQGQAENAFILPPAKIQDVVSVAEAGLSMPQKSTFFYPKIPTGLLFHPLD